jgi:hypothetical protein
MFDNFGVCIFRFPQDATASHHGAAFILFSPIYSPKRLSYLEPGAFNHQLLYQTPTIRLQCRTAVASANWEDLQGILLYGSGAIGESNYLVESYTRLITLAHLPFSNDKAQKHAGFCA